MSHNTGCGILCHGREHITPAQKIFLCKLNRQIKALLRELRKQVEKCAQAVMDTIPAIAEDLESLRQKLLVYRYKFLHFSSCRRDAAQEMGQIKPDIRCSEALVAGIRDKTKERKQLTTEKRTRINVPAAGLEDPKTGL